MKKLLFLLFFSLFVLVACGDTDPKTEAAAEENDTSTAETDSDESEAAEEEGNKEEAAEEDEAVEEEENEESESSAYDEVILDDDTAKVVLTEIETVRDEIFGDEHQIKLEIENKSDQTIEVQSREVSLDGLMADDMAVMSETVAAGKRANGELAIMAFDEELPELNENLEFKLVILGEDFMEITSSDVSIDIK